MPWKRLVRDAAILAALLVAWRAADAGDLAGGARLSTLLRVTAGVALGLGFGYAAHEWGHLAGALAARSRIRAHVGLRQAKLFDFDPGENTRRQFLWMALGGLVVLWLQTLAFAALLPRSLAGVVAIAFALLGAAFTTAVEGPIVARVARGGPLPDAAAPRAPAGAPPPPSAR